MTRTDKAVYGTTAVVIGMMIMLIGRCFGEAIAKLWGL